jgi:hypothetical protein
VNQKDRKRLRDLHARMGSANQGERDAAWRKLDAFLKKHNKSWNDLAELLHEEASASAPPPPDPRDAGLSDLHPFDDPAFTPAGTVYGMLQKYHVLTEHEYVAVALWVIHTHVYEQYMETPRLLLRSPVPGCGKTRLLNVISRLAVRPERHDSITAAAIYYIVSKTKRTLLLDEFDNQEIKTKGALRSILNAGHNRGGKATRVVAGRPEKFDVFAPIALASIGSLWPALMSRSVVIDMQRHNEARTLRRFDLPMKRACGTSISCMATFGVGPGERSSIAIPTCRQRCAFAEATIGVLLSPLPTHAVQSGAPALVRRQSLLAEAIVTRTSP